jgi:hypothetical protein
MTELGKITLRFKKLKLSAMTFQHNDTQHDNTQLNNTQHWETVAQCDDT